MNNFMVYIERAVGIAFLFGVVYATLYGGSWAAHVLLQAAADGWRAY